MLVEKEEELERALLHYKHDGKLLSSSNGRKASSLTFLDDDDVDNNATSKPPPAPSSTTTPNDNDFLYLKNILLQYLSTNERLVHERRPGRDHFIKVFGRRASESHRGSSEHETIEFIRDRESAE